MGMGYGSNHAITMSIENMEKLLPKEMGEFREVIENDNEWDTDCFFRDYHQYDAECKESVVGKAFEKVQEAFEKLTTVGDECLYAEPYFHDGEDNGDRYDDVNGAFFVITGAKKITEPAKKFSEYLDESFWVTFG